MTESHGHWDVEADVVVLGTGGAALTAALSAHDHGAGTVVILERSGMVGGTTAMSGGMLWVPMSHHEQEFGIADSWDEVVTYLDGLSPGLLDPDTFLVAGPEMVRYFADNTLRCGCTCTRISRTISRMSPVPCRAAHGLWTTTCFLSTSWAHGRCG